MKLREIDWEISENHLGPLDAYPKSKVKSNMQVKNAFVECILFFFDLTNLVILLVSMFGLKSKLRLKCMLDSIFDFIF